MMCEIKCHMELSATSHTDVVGPPLESPLLMDLMPPVILFNDINTTQVLLS